MTGRIHMMAAGSAMILWLVLIISLTVFFAGAVYGETGASSVKDLCQSTKTQNVNCVSSDASLMSSTSSCGSGNQGLVCNQWVTLIEEDFEDGFPTAGWESYNWTPTNCAFSEGENSLWCMESMPPCDGPYFSSYESAYASHEPLDIPQDCDILRISFDYHYKMAEDLQEDEDEYLGVYLRWSSSGHW